MSRLAFQVRRKELFQPEMVIGMFGATRRDSTDCAFIAAESLREALNRAGIRFAATDEDPLLVIRIGREDFPRFGKVNKELSTSNSKRERGS